MVPIMTSAARWTAIKAAAMELVPRIASAEFPTLTPAINEATAVLLEDPGFLRRLRDGLAGVFRDLDDKRALLRGRLPDGGRQPEDEARSLVEALVVVTVASAIEQCNADLPVMGLAEIVRRAPIRCRFRPAGQGAPWN